MRRFRLTPSAKQDLTDIWDYIAADSVPGALKVPDDLETAVQKLARNPNLGHWREDLADRRHRFFLAHSYLIVYRYEPKPIQIVRVLHASRDLKEILSLPTTEQ